MSNILTLRSAETLNEIAHMLGYKPDRLAYIVYKIPNSQKYSEFTIPKKNGSLRAIKSPEKRLKLLQRRLAKLLYACLSEVEELNTLKDGKIKKRARPVSHGFAKGRSIISNANPHKCRRYVFNIDIEDFFHSINFGRVRGVLIKDYRFKLNEKVATLISQIACHDNVLPQGSPCSPVISNIVSHILDIRLVRLAKKFKCTYTRYADDITFSTNQKFFPEDLAVPVIGSTGKWEPGQVLLSEIKKAGYEISANKTRMQVRGSRQITTGLIVNKKVNVKSEYYRKLRSMCSSLFNYGYYYVNKPSLADNGKNSDAKNKEIMKSLAPLQGMLEHVYNVRNCGDGRDSAEKKRNPTAIRKLYHKFMFYKNFVCGDVPLIITEGKTDHIYLASAIEMLPKFQPKLGGFESEKFKLNIKFLNFTKSVHDILQLGGGTGDLKFFIRSYASSLKNYRHCPLAYPVILVIDNDDGASEIFSILHEMWNGSKKSKKSGDVKKKSTLKTGSQSISHKTKDLFYMIVGNLYIVKTPERVGSDNHSSIEDCFDSETLSKELGGKKFDRANNHDTQFTYGKKIFAESVIKKHKQEIDFSGFTPLLSRIEAAIDDYSKKCLLSISQEKSPINYK